MAYVALYRKYRSQTFHEISGQEHIKKTLLNAVRHNKIAHAYLFSGPRGTGKTSVAKILAKAVNCENPQDGEPCNACPNCISINRGMNADAIEIDAASNNGVDEIREIRDRVKYLPSTGKYKVYIIDEVHMLSTGAFNALLKTLEEPPAHAIFILATTEAYKIPATILSRCQRFDFKSIQIKDIEDRIEEVCQMQNQKITPEAVRLIAECAEGGMRDALSLLDQAISYGAEEVTAEDIFAVSGSINTSHMIALAHSILNREVTEVLTILERIIDDGKEITRIAVDLIAFYRDVLLFKTRANEEKSIYQQADFISFAKTASNQKLYFYIQQLNEAQQNMKWTNQKRTFLEMAFIKMSDQLEVLPLDMDMKIIQLEKKIQELEKHSKSVSTGPAWKEQSVPRVIPESIMTKALEPMIDGPCITGKMIEEVLNYGDKEKRKEIESSWEMLISSAKTRGITTLLSKMKPGACNATHVILVGQDLSICEQLMRLEMKQLVLEAINARQPLVQDYYAIPEDVWNIVLEEFTKQLKVDKIPKPNLEHIQIGVRIFEQKQTDDSPMVTTLKETFGEELVKVKE